MPRPFPQGLGLVRTEILHPGCSPWVVDWDPHPYPVQSVVAAPLTFLPP